LTHITDNAFMIYHYHDTYMINQHNGISLYGKLTLRSIPKVNHRYAQYVYG